MLTSANAQRSLPADEIVYQTVVPLVCRSRLLAESAGYSFESIDVLSSESAYAHMRKISGQSLTPTLEMPDGKVLPDFDVRQLEKFLQANNILP